MFLSTELDLLPSAWEDRVELEARITSSFEPHGRCRFIGFPAASEGSETPNDRKYLTVGESGKVKSFDFEKMEVEVRPDRKREMRVRLPLETIEPDTTPLETLETADSGPDIMHVFKEDPPILARVKKGDERFFAEMVERLRA
jgi:hypothetical protein